MIRLTFAEYRALPQDARSKVLTVGTARYKVCDYVGPIVAAGVSAIERVTSGIILGSYDEDDREAETRACRDMDAVRIAAIRQLIKPNKNNWAGIGELKLDWPVQHKAWTTWSGQQTYTGLLAKYLAAMGGWMRECDALDYEIGVSGVSGLMPGHAKLNALDMGFSPSGLDIATRPWREVAMLIGVQCAPILTRDDVYSVYWRGDWHSWRVVERVKPYLYAWEPIMAHPLTDS